MARIISVEEVRKHNGKNGVWMVIHNDVYDVTSFLEEHPGGEESLMDVAGKDGTQGFEDVGHSDDARELLKKYKIGTLPADQKMDFVDNCCKAKVVKRSSKSPPRSEFKLPPTPKIERRVHSCVVPLERPRRESPRPREYPCGRPNYLKWAVLALAGAAVLGFVYKKYVSK